MSKGILVLPECRFGDGRAVARFSMSAGCVGFPDDREQDLCIQHIIRTSPLGDMELITEYIPDILQSIK